MKKIMNIQLLGFPVLTTLIAAFWLLVVTWMWWGSLFNGEMFPALSWPELNGLTEADLNGLSTFWSMLGVLAIFVQTLGLTMVLKWRSSLTIMTAVQTGLLVSIMFVVPIAAYPLIFRPEHNLALFLVDAGNYVIGLVTTAVLLTVLPGIRQESA